MRELPDWSKIGFNLTETDTIYTARGRLDDDPVWSEGGFGPFGNVSMSPAAAFMSYGQGVFEGLKSRRAEDDRILVFRPQANARRFGRSAERLGMPAFPEEQFVRAVLGVVDANRRFVPPAGSGSFYVRPVQVASEPRLGLTLCHEFTVLIYGSPVGGYFGAGGKAGLKVRVLEQGRVAPGGTGAAKAMGNYAGTIPLAAPWKKQGFDDVMFLDARHVRYVTETVGSNLFAVLRDGTLVTPPLDDQILPGVTRDSVLKIAREMLGMKVEERPLPIEEVLDGASEFFCSGTAYTLQPVKELSHRDRIATFGDTPARNALFEILDGIQTGRRDDPFGWITTL